MRALTLHQPWATLIALGIKTIETRSWPPPRNLIGQTIAIHAGRRLQPNPGPQIETILRRTYGDHWRRLLPAGAVVATATVRDACQVAGPAADTGCIVTRDGQIVPADPYGDFSTGRWLLLLSDISPLPKPIPATGRQRLWRWEPPAAW